MLIIFNSFQSRRTNTYVAHTLANILNNCDSHFTEKLSGAIKDFEALQTTAAFVLRLLSTTFDSYHHFGVFPRTQFTTNTILLSLG